MKQYVLRAARQSSSAGSSVFTAAIESAKSLGNAQAVARLFLLKRRSAANVGLRFHLLAWSIKQHHHAEKQT
jgi:hypothetical protein